MAEPEATRHFSHWHAAMFSIHPPRHQQVTPVGGRKTFDGGGGFIRLCLYLPEERVRVTIFAGGARMDYQFPPDLKKIVRERMESGKYGSEDDLLRDALKALEDRQFVIEHEDPEVVEGIKRGLADMNAGRSQRIEDFGK